MTLSRLPAIILARGGSKGIPNKNLHPFAGKPLLAWSILQAQAAQTIDEVLVSSDCQKILDVAAEFGARGILRPDELATDTATSESALLHVLDTAWHVGKEPEAMVFLQATSPLREPSDIDGAVSAFRAAKADSLFSDAVLDDLCAWYEESGILKGKTFDPFNRGRRQDRKPLYLENGSIYVFKASLLRRAGNRLGGKIARFSMDFWKSFEIDTMENMELCEYYFRKHLLQNWHSLGQANESFTPKAIVYDFDGVMTDNRVMVTEEGAESVLVNRADGWGVARLRDAGVRQVILSTETNRVVAARAKKLQIEVIQGSSNKARDLVAWCAEQGISPESVFYVGNDVNDVAAMKLTGWPIAPSDAHPDAIAVAKHVTRSRGGEGVIKEIAELLLGPAIG